MATDEQFKQASDFLREVHKNVRLYWTDNTDLSQAMASGEVDLALRRMDDARRRPVVPGGEGEEAVRDHQPVHGLGGPGRPGDPTEGVPLVAGMRPAVPLSTVGTAALTLEHVYDAFTGISLYDGGGRLMGSSAEDRDEATDRRPGDGQQQDQPETREPSDEPR